jgi:hypothetical protein
MTTVILVGLIVVLAVAAAFVGVLLVRRWRPSSSESGSAAPWTVGDLVRMRNGRPALGVDLFTPATGLPVSDPAVGEPVSEVAGEPGACDGAAPGRRASSAPVARPDDPAEVVDVGDAPWRRAARINGAEPGGAWETAPNPVVLPAPRSTEPEVRRPAGSSRRDAVQAAAPDPEPEPEPADRPVESVVELEPVVPLVPGPAVASEPDVVEPVPVGADPEPLVEPALSEVSEAVGRESVAVSRPLSDPDLTPLMGIPLVRPSAADEPAADEPALDGPAPDELVPDNPALDDPAPDDAADAPSGSSQRSDPVPPPPRTAPARRTDDEVVALLTAEVALPPETVTGSPQPVWLRVVRRDGDPVADAVVTLLDDRGQQVDATKTAADGGGELRTPHGGCFLLIAGRDGYQPRAVTLTVDDAPVEVALLLPRSATLAGLVCGGEGRPVAGARVVARQEGEVVDEIVTGPDGGYRFDDLAEGAYAVTATDRRGTAVLRVDVRESADLHLDLDLVPPGGAP